MGTGGELRPALLKSTSRRPNASLVLAKRAFTAAGSVTSVGTASARGAVGPAFLRDLVQPFRPAPGEDHAVSVLQERERRGLADAAARPGDEGDPAVESHGLFKSPLSVIHSARRCGQYLRVSRRDRLPILNAWPPRRIDVNLHRSTGASRYFWNRLAMTRDAPRSSLATSRKAGGEHQRGPFGDAERPRVDQDLKVGTAAQTINRVGGVWVPLAGAACRPSTPLRPPPRSP